MSRGAPPESALAAEMFDSFCSAGTMKQILSLFREMCNTLTLRPNRLPAFYPKLKTKLANSWKAQALFKKFDARATHKVYDKGQICAQNKVLIIGAGPCGLRAAIECQLLGAKVVVIEKRDRLSRNNVLHLWPFVIQDLRALGAKKFFGKFCAGSIDHISIRQLQCILMKVALLLGVEFHEGVSFEELLEPTVVAHSEKVGWRARTSPADHPVSQYEFDALIGADGKRNTLQGFKRKEFRGKLAMAITANFINRHTEQEASVPEISGVAFIFNQKFFKDLKEKTGIDLENIVYYKDDTHYFVMTAKKHSLLSKGVLINDYPEVSRLLSAENMDRAALMRYAEEAARFSTEERLPKLEFAHNHSGQPDVALFDFTSMYTAENASLVYERLGFKLLCQLVGDSLLEPFWPTGSGCARGFLSALDAAWAVRAWGQSPAPHPLEVIAERESVYRLLGQTTPDNLNRDFGAYTLEPSTRYPNLNRGAVSPHRVTSFYNSDEPQPLDAPPPAKKRRKVPEVSDETLLAWVDARNVRAAVQPSRLAAVVRRYRPDLMPDSADPRLVYTVLHQEFRIVPFSSNGSPRNVPIQKLRTYLGWVYAVFKGEVPHIDHQTNMFIQMKKNQNVQDYSVASFSNAADTETHSSSKKKRRSARAPQVSNDPAEYIRQKIGKLDLNDITQLARLIEGHDAVTDEKHNDKQKGLQEQILALLDPDDSPDPQMVRNSLAQLLQGNTKTNLKTKEPKQASNLAQFFENSKDNAKHIKSPRRLKGLDADSIKVLDFSNIFQDDSDDTLVDDAQIPKKKEFSHMPSIETSNRNEPKRSPSIEPQIPQIRRLSDVQDLRKSSSPDFPPLYGRSSSIGSAEMVHNTRRIAQMFEGNRRRQTPSPESRFVRSGSLGNPEMAQRRQRMAEIIEGKRPDIPSPDRSKLSESIGNPEMALRKQRVVDLIEGIKPRRSPESSPQRRNSGEMAFRMQRVSDLMQKKNADAKRMRTGGRRKAAREIMRQRFEKSLQMLAAEPRLDFSTAADLDHDYGLQQYRASAPQFDERVKKLEKKLQHYEEGRVVGGGGRAGSSGVGGERVARLAAELAGTTAPAPAPRASKPKDLLRSVGKIDMDDWKIKEIERKIQENQFGRPEPKTAERVPKWDREQFLGRKKKLKEGDGGDERYEQLDETFNKLDQKRRDSGRPELGTKKVANLATKFVKNEKPETIEIQPKEYKKSWRGPATTGVPCAACGARVFAAEDVVADGLHLHRSCFRCAVCKAVLRPGNYTTEQNGMRLVCMRHTGAARDHTDEAVAKPATRAASAPETSPPERISLELSQGVREIDEDEFTDRNCLASDTSAAGGLSDDEDSSSDTDVPESDETALRSPQPAGGAADPCPRRQNIPSEESSRYGDYSDDEADSSGNETCPRMRAAREARRLEVPATARTPTDSSEMESEEESESSDEVSSATEVSTDSEFAREECAPPPSPPAILVTEATPHAPAPPPPPPPPQDYPLSRTRSAGGLATKRALELKRKYLLGEPSPLAVRKSDSTSQLDTKFEAFRSNITEFQKMLHPAPSPTDVQPPKLSVTFQLSAEYRKLQPMPDIIKNLCSDAPVDLLTKGDSPLCKKDWQEPTVLEKDEPEIESDSLSEDSSHTETGPNKPVPRVEVHDEGGELIQLDSLTLINSGTEDNDERASGTATTTGPTVVGAESESSESCHDATTLALTETELSDWAVESAVLDDFEEKDEKSRRKNPRTLKGPKIVHDAKNITAISSHVCGRSSPQDSVMYCNAAEHFEFADEGDQDPSIETPTTPRNEGYIELVDDEYDPYFHTNDRSMNFIERTFSETVIRPVAATVDFNKDKTSDDLSNIIEYIDKQDSTSESNQKEAKPSTSSNVPATDKVLNESSSSKTFQEKISKNCDATLSSSSSNGKNVDLNNIEIILESVSLSDISPPLEKEVIEIENVQSKTDESDPKSETSIDDTSPPLASESKSRDSSSVTPKQYTFSGPCTIRLYSPAICRSASENFKRPSPIGTDASTRTFDKSLDSFTSDLMSSPARVMTDKVQELKREREEQTEVVRRLVLERLGSGHRASRKSPRRSRMSPASNAPVPPPVPPELPAPPPVPPPPASHAAPPRPALPLLPLPVTPSLSDPELARERRRKGLMRSISKYFNKRLGPRHKDERRREHKSTGALQDPPSVPPPVPPPPAAYYAPIDPPNRSTACLRRREGDLEERDAMQMWFEARWARLAAQRRRHDAPGEPTCTRLHRRSSRPLSAEQQAETVAHLMQKSAQRVAHEALLAADRRRNNGGVGD